MNIPNVPEDFPQLETDRLILRKMTPDDAEPIFQIFADDEVTKFYDVASFTSIGQARELIELNLERFNRREGIRWAIVRKEDDTLVGTCGYNNLYKTSRRGVIGYDLARAYWGKGIITEALRVMIRYGFEGLGLNRIEAFVMPENLASMNALRKLGFREEGVLREYGFWKGQFVDLKCFSLLKREYRERDAPSSATAV